MEISLSGANFIAQFEGFSAKPYTDAVGVWTIGYGTTMYPDGRKVASGDAPVSKEQGLNYLLHHVNALVSPYINKTFPSLSQPQFDSLCSFAYNLGAGALERSSLRISILKKIGCEEITENFARWNKAGGKVLAGLTRRREAEAKLFCTEQYN